MSSMVVLPRLADGHTGLTRHLPIYDTRLQKADTLLSFLCNPIKFHNWLFNPVSWKSKKNG
jgi:hypothetical protein